MPIATVNGINLGYRIQGKGPPLVLAHGLATGSYIWGGAAEALQGRFQVIAYDHRGHGATDKPPGPYSIQQLADDLAGLLNFLGLEKADIIGHSMGGRTALLFALQHPDFVGRLMLVGASGAAPQGPARARLEALRKAAAEEGVAAVFDHPGYQGAMPAAFKKGSAREAFRERFLQNTPEGITGSIDAILSMPDLTGRLGEIAAPAWVCAGDADAGPLEFNALCGERIPRCARSAVPGCGHYPMLDNPAGFLDALYSFLKKNPAP